VIFTVSKLEHPWNVSFSIEVTPEGIVIDVNEEHAKNARIPIDATDDGMTVDVRL